MILLASAPAGAAPLDALRSRVRTLGAGVDQVGRALAERLARPGWRQVRRVVDGDTLLLHPREKLRLIGVDTPESVHPDKPVQPYAKEASAFTRGLVEGRWVRVVPGYEACDRYGRSLGFVHLADRRVLNELLIRRGYARAYTRFAFEGRPRYRALERAARAAGVGLWGRSLEGSLSRSIRVTQPGGVYFVTRRGRSYHRAACRYLRGNARPAPTSLERLRPCAVCRP